MICLWWVISSAWSATQFGYFNFNVLALKFSIYPIVCIIFLCVSWPSSFFIKCCPKIPPTQQSITLTKLIQFYRSLTSPRFHQFLLYFLRLLLPMAAAQLLWSRHHTPLREAALFEHHAGAGGDHARQRNGEELRHFFPMITWRENVKKSLPDSSNS